MTDQHTPAPDSAEARYKAEVDRVNRITDREIDEALTKFPKVLAALHESEKADVAGAIERLTKVLDGPFNLGANGYADADIRALIADCARLSEEPKPVNRAILDAGFAKIDAQALRIEALEGERDLALKECVRLATEVGSAKGKLEASEAAGIVDGWRESCVRLETEADGRRYRILNLEGGLKTIAAQALNAEYNLIQQGGSKGGPAERAFAAINEVVVALLGTEGRDDG